MNDIECEYNKRLSLFNLDLINRQKERLREKGYKFINVPDAIAPELRDEIYSKPTLQHLQAENNRLKTTLKNLKSLMLDPDCVQDKGDIYVMVHAIDKTLNGESEE